ncbi:MAG: hypothetical protein F4Y04_06690 [Chloroflexi bacterium]|nr:hypothetical protein [Chloroflexota bacterium]
MADHQLGDGPIEEEYRDMMKGVGEAFDSVFNPDYPDKPRKLGFVLLTFPYGSTDGRCNFLSNGAAREDIVVLFKEMIRRFEGGADEPTGHA